VTPTAPALAVLRGLWLNRSQGREPPEHWFTSIADPPRAGGVRDDVPRLAAAARGAIRRER
jgi:acetoin utilization protein AcuC